MKKLIAILTLFVAVAFHVCVFAATKKSDSEIPDIKKTDKKVVFQLERGIITNNGATPWYTTIGVGTPPQKLKFMLDTDSVYNWVTAEKCTTYACKLHGKFNNAKSLTYTPYLGYALSSIDLGAWGSMKVSKGTDYFNCDHLKIPLKFYQALYYNGDQFNKLVWDGGIGVPSTTTNKNKEDSTVLSNYLERADKIDYPIVSFWTNRKNGKGAVIFGAVDSSKFKRETLNIVQTIHSKLRPNSWVIPLQKFDVDEKTVLNNVPLALDSGSSAFKGDRNFIDAIKDAITKNGRLPEVLHSSTPDFKQYPIITLTINGIKYKLKPEQYFMNTGKEEWTLGFQYMPEYKNILLVGSVFLDSVYSVFYSQTRFNNVRAVGLAETNF